MLSPNPCLDSLPAAPPPLPRLCGSSLDLRASEVAGAQKNVQKKQACASAATEIQYSLWASEPHIHPISQRRKLSLETRMWAAEHPARRNARERPPGGLLWASPIPSAKSRVGSPASLLGAGAGPARGVHSLNPCSGCRGRPSHIAVCAHGFGVGGAGTGRSGPGAGRTGLC